MTDNLKLGWRRVRLGDVVCQVKDRIANPTASAMTHYVPGGGISADDFRLRDWQPVNDGLMGPAFHMCFRPGHTLYKSRVPHGVAIADREGICANTTYILESLPEKLLPELLPYLLKTVRYLKFESDNDHGSTNLFLNFSDIAHYEFDLPPLSEQRRIVARLEGARAVLDTTLDTLAHAKMVCDSYLTSTLQAGNQVALKDVLRYCKVGIVVQPKSLYDDGPGAIPALMAQNVKDGQLTGEIYTRIRCDAHERNAKSRLAIGDVVVTRRGYYAGAAAAVSEMHAGWNAIDVLILGCSDLLDAHFLACFINSPLGQRAVEAHAVGTDLRFLSAGEFERLTLPLLPLTVQREIVAQVDALSRLSKMLIGRKASAHRFMLESIQECLGGD